VIVRETAGLLAKGQSIDVDAGCRWSSRGRSMVSRWSRLRSAVNSWGAPSERRRRFPQVLQDKKEAYAVRRTR
jgi:hypothetical protein